MVCGICPVSIISIIIISSLLSPGPKGKKLQYGSHEPLAKVAPDGGFISPLKQNKEKLIHGLDGRLRAVPTTIGSPQSGGSVLLFESKAGVETDSAAIPCSSDTIFRERVVFGERADTKDVCFCFFFVFLLFFS